MVGGEDGGGRSGERESQLCVDEVGTGKEGEWWVGKKVGRLEW